MLTVEEIVRYEREGLVVPEFRLPEEFVQVGAFMSGTGMSEAQFKQMLLDGGRSIEGNRSRKERRHG